MPHERITRICEAANALKENPQDVDALVEMGEIAVSLGLPDPAHSYLEKASSISAQHAGVLNLEKNLDRLAHKPDLRVSIIVLCWNQLDFTKRCLASLRRTVPAGLAEIILVDNGSTDGTYEWASSQPDLIVIHNTENRGFGPANNQAAAQAKGEFLLFLNNDTETQNGWLDQMLSTADLSLDIGAVGAKIVTKGGMLLEAGATINLNATCTNRGREAHQSTPSFTSMEEVEYVSACCLLIRKDAFNKIGGFDPLYAPAYYEDVDLCVSLRKAGYRLIYDPNVWVVHAESVTARAVTGSEDRRLRLQEQAREKFIHKWGSEYCMDINDPLGSVRVPILPEPIRVAILIPYDGPDCLWGEAMNAADMRDALEWRRDVHETRIFSYATASQIEFFKPDLVLSWTAWRHPLQFKDSVSLFFIVNYTHEFMPAGVSMTWEDALRMNADLYAANSPGAVQKLGQYKPSRLIHLAANPRIHRPMGLTQRYRSQVTYLGSYNPATKSSEVFDRYILPAEKFDLALWGEMWDKSPDLLRRHWRGVLPIPDVARLYSSVDIAIGFNAKSQAEAGMVNNRVFEVLASGALLLSDKVPAIQELFGDCAAFTDGYNQSRDLIEYYLSNPDERHSLAGNARERILSAHTYDHRARDIIQMYADHQKSRGRL